MYCGQSGYFLNKPRLCPLHSALVERTLLKRQESVLKFLDKNRFLSQVGEVNYDRILEKDWITY